MAIKEIIAPLISVILPVFNGEKYLQKAIDSVLNQSYTNLEVIVINDGSNDLSQAIIDSYKGRLRSYYQENSGVAKARNLGISHAKGLFITFLDQDDFYHRERFGIFMKDFLNTNKLVMMGHTQFVFEDENSKLRWPNLLNPNKTFIKLLGAGIFHYSIFKEIGDFIEDLKSGDDLEWFFRLKKIGVEIHQVDDIVLYYRQHSTNVSAEKKQVDTFVIKSLKYILDGKRNSPQGYD